MVPVGERIPFYSDSQYRPLPSVHLMFKVKGPGIVVLEPGTQAMSQPTLPYTPKSAPVTQPLAAGPRTAGDEMPTQTEETRAVNFTARPGAAFSAITNCWMKSRAAAWAWSIAPVR